MTEKLQPFAGKERTEDLIRDLITVWEASVRATHTFLSPENIEAIRPLVVDGLREIPVLIVSYDDLSRPNALMGLDGQKIEMLFINPECRGLGLGRKLVDLAVREHKANSLDVNEQNDQAVGFYRHLGFTIIGWSPVDSGGMPFPLLHMLRCSDPDCQE